MDETRNTNSDDAIAALVRLAGRRPPVAEDAKARVRAAVHDEWMQTIGRRKRTRWVTAVAAAVAITITAIVMQRAASTPAPMPRAIVASVQNIAGGAIAGDGAARHLLDSGSPILAGELIETATNAAASLSWGNVTLRLDGGTRIHIASTRELDLQQGAVYIASNHSSASGVVVRTRLGAVHDIGTQFEVRLTGDQVRVRVREGRIDLRQGTASHSAQAGIELDANTQGAVTQHAISRNGAEWDWIVRAAPPIQLEGRTLSDVVNAVTHEEGVTPVWSDAASRAAASKRLHGAVPLSPDEALYSALVASGLSARSDGDRFIIQRKR